MKRIEAQEAPAAIGPYSQAYEAAGLVITSGQLGVDPETNQMPETIEAQAELSCQNVGNILSAAGCGFEDVVKTTCYLTDIADFAAFNGVYARFFTGKPARSCFAVRQLPREGARCEIEVIAEKKA